MSELVQLRKVDGIAVVTIDNPPVNAMSSAVSAGIAGAVAQIEDDASIRAVVFIGAKLIKSIGETFHGRHTFTQAFAA